MRSRAIGGSRAKRLFGLVVTVPVLAVAPAASALTLRGSGSSAAYPYMQKLFQAYNRLHRNTQFKYNQDGGNAGAQDVQASPRRSAFAIQTRPPLKSDGGLTYAKLFLDGLCIAVNPANSLSARLHK